MTDQSWHELFPCTVIINTMTYQSWHELFSYNVIISTITDQSWHELFACTVIISTMTDQSCHELFPCTVIISTMTDKSWLELFPFTILISTMTDQSWHRDENARLYLPNRLSFVVWSCLRYEWRQTGHDVILYLKLIWGFNKFQMRCTKFMPGLVCHRINTNIKILFQQRYRSRKQPWSSRG